MGRHTAESLVRDIANEINAKSMMNTQEKEALAEHLMFHLTQILVGRSATPSGYLYAFKQQTPLGREYFNFGNRGFNIATLFAIAHKLEVITPKRGPDYLNFMGKFVISQAD